VKSAIAVAAAIAAFAEVGCGQQSNSIVRSSGCAGVTLFFTIPATSGQMAAVLTRLRADPEVKSERLITRKQAFEQMLEKFPALKKTKLANPLPARIPIQVSDGVDSVKFVDRYERLKLAGVARVERIRSDGGPCFVQ